MKKSIKISIRISLVFVVAILCSFIPDYLHGFFGDTYCGTGSGHWVFSKSEFAGHYQFCNYSNEHEPTWHWGYRHWLFLFMGISLAVVQVVDIILSIDKET